MAARPGESVTVKDELGNSVLIEFGGRNITEPNEAHEVRPDIAEHLPELDFPCPTVNVLSPARTFWGKATLIRVECRRDEFRVAITVPAAEQLVNLAYLAIVAARNRRTEHYQLATIY